MIEVDQAKLNAYRAMLQRRSDAPTATEFRNAKKALQQMWSAANGLTRLAMDRTMHEFDAQSITPAKPWNPYEAADPNWPQPHREPE